MSYKIKYSIKNLRKLLEISFFGNFKFLTSGLGIGLAPPVLVLWQIGLGLASSGLGLGLAGSGLGLGLGLEVAGLVNNTGLYRK